MRTPVIAFFLTVILAAGTALAQGGEPGKGEFGKREHWGRRHHGRGHIFAKLELTDAQKEQIRQIRLARRDELKPIMEQIRAKHQEIRQSTEGGTFNEALVAQKLTEVAALKAKLMGARFEMRKEVMAVLTPEQKSKLEQMKSEFKERRHGRRNKGF